MIDQVSSSLCGPAAFFFSLAKIRPDLYTGIAIALYKTGKSTLGSLTLESSGKARNYSTSAIRGLDWMTLTSIKPDYDHPSEQFDGITLPGKLTSWFNDVGFSSAKDITNIMSPKGIDNLLAAQNDYSAGHTICLFVDADVFNKPGRKQGPSSFPNHWVVLNSNIQVREFDEKTNTLRSPVVINALLAKLLKKEYQNALWQAEDDAGDAAAETVESKDTIMLNAFTWGQPLRPVYSRVSTSLEAQLYYVMRGYYGYVRARWQ